MKTLTVRNGNEGVLTTRPKFRSAAPITKCYLLPQRIGATMAAVLAHRLRCLDVTVTILCRGRNADAVRPMEVLYLNTYRGTGIVVTATGPDSKEAIEVFEQTLAEPWYGEEATAHHAHRTFDLHPTGTCG